MVETNQGKFLKLFDLTTGKGRWRYGVLSFLLFILLRTIENAIHELSHCAVVLLVGGGLRENPVLVTPLGGVARWKNVPTDMLPLVNISGTAGALFIFSIIFIPLYLKSKTKLAKWVGYWGIALFVNITFYWFFTPLVTDAVRFDPVAFAFYANIRPFWIVGIISLIPFSLALFSIIKATKTIGVEILDDPEDFHIKVLFGIYIFYLIVNVLIYLRITDHIVKVI